MLTKRNKKKTLKINFASYFYYPVSIVHTNEAEIFLKWKSSMQWISNTNSTIINKQIQINNVNASNNLTNQNEYKFS